jgi:hypothetical protein
MGTKIYNSALTREIREGVRLQTSSDATPSEISDKVMLTCETNPKLLRNLNYIQNTIITDTTAGTIATFPTDRDVYLHSAWLNYQKDVLATAANVSISVVLNGVETNLIKIAVIGTTVGQGTQSLNFPLPVKPDRGSLLRLRMNAAGSTCTVAGGVLGYIDDSNA